MIEMLAFWNRKKDDFDIQKPGLTHDPLGLPPLHEEVPVPPEQFQGSQQMQQKDLFTPPKPEEYEVKPLQQPQEYRPEMSKDLQLLSAKLDTIKVILENILIRLDKIEKEKESREIRW